MKISIRRSERGRTLANNTFSSGASTRIDITPVLDVEFDLLYTSWSLRKVSLLQTRGTSVYKYVLMFPNEISPEQFRRHRELELELWEQKSPRYVLCMVTKPQYMNE